MSLSVAATVRTQVAATATSAHGAHHGQDNFLLPSESVIAARDCPNQASPSSEFPVSGQQWYARETNEVKNLLPVLG